MSEESLIREVEEEVRKEQIKRLWDRFGVYILGLCFVVILGVGGYKLWQYYERQQALTAGQQYVEAMELADQGKMEEAQAAFAKLAESSREGPKTLAILQEAALKASRNDIPGAVAAYDGIAADENAPPALRDLARIRAGFLLVDTATPDDLKQRVGSLIAEGNPWRNAAREIVALAAYRTGDLETANSLLSEIMGDPRASMGSRQRAQIVSALVTAAMAAKSATSSQAPAGGASETPAANHSQAPAAPAAPEAAAPNSGAAAPQAPAADGESNTSSAPAGNSNSSSE
ncbi:tetratricopeptide repeat protein [Rhodoligotrophos ferricapiens]|uniref:tetratricopeptide repeat protein n=1 Tax=Rhodoligotrophos ferricapiens TaxID=3069264 RepID=UPI00315D3AAE